MPALHAATCANSAIQADFAADGSYSVTLQATANRLTGKTVTVGQIARSIGHDALGSYCELSLRMAEAQTDSIRVYASSPTATFTVRLARTSAAALDFPVLAGFSPDLQSLGFRVQPFGTYQFHFLGTQGPWLLFDDHAHALVLSPADHFFVSQMQMSNDTLHSSLLGSISALPAGFTHTTVLVVGSGIHTTLASWGHAMQSWVARPAVANDADPLLRKLSYWTDNGANYYYKFDPKLGYTGTLLAVARQYPQNGVSLGLMQLDSWFYPKGPQKDWRVFNWKNGAGGAYLYQPDKRLFPNGMGAFAQQLHLPLAVHGRWIDQTSPYRKEYKVSGNVIVDPRYWEATAAWMQAAHVAVYEQDWLGTFAQAAHDLTSPQQFHDQMARAMLRHGITMQYCMPAPADYLQGTRYSNLTTIRTSDDRFERRKWDSFLYDSQVAYALGIWPWTDVFMSSELPNLILSTLSSGPVGVGDALDHIDAANLLRAARADGVIAKPDQGIRPLDRMYLADARVDAQNPAGSMIAVAFSAQPAARISYVFAYPRQAQTTAEFTPAELGYSGSAYVYDWRNHRGVVLGANAAATIPFTDGWGYAIVAPIAPNGLALIGDAGMITTAARQRVLAQADTSGSLRVRMLFAAQEKPRSLLLYAAHSPHTRAISGRILASHYDPITHLLSLTLATGRNEDAEVAVSR